jgi:hypothetical protein
MNRSRLAVAGVALAALSLPPASSEPPAPLVSLPPFMKVLVDWGVRPEWSRDGRKLLFMERGLGDAYSVDLATREVLPLTAHFYNQGFDRVLALANGDYLLTGPRAVDPKAPWSGRHTSFEMFVLDRSLTKPPVPLGAALDEGPAVSRTRMHVAWTLPGQREMREADIVYADGVPRLASERRVLSYADRPPTQRLETQDFRPPDEKELLFACYSGTVEEPFFFSDVCGIDLPSGRITNYTQTPQQYDEPENVFPDGRHIMVESDRHGINVKWKIDIYRLALDGTNTAERMTFFDASGGPYHGSNPVVSPDGRWAAVQLGIHGMGAGQGRGIVLLDLEAWEKTLENPPGTSLP